MDQSKNCFGIPNEQVAHDLSVAYAIVTAARKRTISEYKDTYNAQDEADLMKFIETLYGDARAIYDPVFGIKDAPRPKP